MREDSEEMSSRPCVHTSIRYRANSIIAMSNTFVPSSHTFCFERLPQAVDGVGIQSTPYSSSHRVFRGVLCVLRSVSNRVGVVPKLKEQQVRMGKGEREKGKEGEEGRGKRGEGRGERESTDGKTQTAEHRQQRARWTEGGREQNSEHEQKAERRG